MSSINIDSQRLWNNHEQRVIKILFLALEMMRKEDNLDIDENKLNRKLYKYILKANRILHKKNEEIGRASCRERV